jgi:hypothetical protein
MAAPFCKLLGYKHAIVIKLYDDPAAAEPRQVEPYAVGYSQGRDVLFFGRQVKGYSTAAESGVGALPSWRSFRMDRIRFIANELGPAFEPILPDADEYRSISEFICKNDSVRWILEGRTHDDSE